MIIFKINLKTKSDQNTHQNACPRTPLAKCISNLKKKFLATPLPNPGYAPYKW